MQNLFDEVSFLDKRSCEKFGLSEDILMEHAAGGMARFIREKFPLGTRVTLVCGGGNNGADGVCLARLLYKDYDVKIFQIHPAKSPMALLQDKRSHLIKIPRTLDLSIHSCDLVVDAIFGTGFRGSFDSEARAIIQTMNKMSAYKIACDVPSGLKSNGQCDINTFEAQTTLTMGALKKSLFSDRAKDFVGEIKVLDLGLARTLYETTSNWKVLNIHDIDLPLRHRKNTHKGTFGHLAISLGEKAGASIISGLSALNFGAGLVTLVTKEEKNLQLVPFTLMTENTLPKNTKAIACGMGVGAKCNPQDLKKFLNNSLPLVADAGIFGMEIVLEILERKKVVITPHPKEFVSLLHLTKIADISIEELQNNRFKYSEIFCQKYPNVTLLLKGANVIIGQNNDFFVNPHGTSVLAKAGSGDVLSGLIGALLTQGYTPLNAAIHGSLAHTKLALNFKGADFSLTPDDLITGIGDL